ncbi:iron complex transport system ATP-binding protein [Geothermobacter ehrlichii]|uniref:Iron complex transport system ATP-binding protein n=1 Tax=Geothermobacter ehrlichii TaxID=213224 RepID=A0A5D3WPD3_9BACT|nr:ABC transporter ATP-binding protein [Geothermobacter ehrlichii]TYO99268.1 iron complex transport system ATP-binding protein [Geothermobacter ehrlichii]
MAELRVDKLRFRRGGFSLELDGLRIAPGEKVAILGENGCGKSTLLQLLAGLLPPDGGTLSYAGKPLKKIPMARRAQLFALLPQFSEVIFPFSVFEVVLFGRFPHRQGNAFTAADRQLSKEMLALLDLSDLAERPFSQLSGGEKRRVMLARVLNQQAPLLYLDEPNAGLDIRHALEIFSLLRERTETIVAPVHDINLAHRFFERFLLLKNGRLLADVPRDELTPELLAETYDVQVATGTAAFLFQH